MKLSAILSHLDEEAKEKFLNAIKSADETTVKPEELDLYTSELKNLKANIEKRTTDVTKNLGLVLDKLEEGLTITNREEISKQSEFLIVILDMVEADVAKALELITTIVSKANALKAGQGIK